MQGRDPEGPILDEDGGHPGRRVKQRDPERKQELDIRCHENEGLRRALNGRRKSDGRRLGPAGCLRRARVCSKPSPVMGDSSSGLDSMGRIKHVGLWVVRMPSILPLHGHRIMTMLESQRQHYPHQTSGGSASQYSSMLPQKRQWTVVQADKPDWDTSLASLFVHWLLPC